MLKQLSIYCRPYAVSVRRPIYRSAVLFYTTLTRDTPKSFQASPLVMPKSKPNSTTTGPDSAKSQNSPLDGVSNQQQQNQNNSAVPAEDINDFALTSLVHGSTDLEIAITARARDKLYSISNEDKNVDSALRIGVESGGCHGFQYNLKLTSVKDELNNDKDLLVFSRSDGHPEQFGRAQIILDENSLQILQESKVDYTKELIGSQFKVVDSPYTSTACGCGSSFDFDFDKLQQKMDSK